MVYYKLKVYTEKLQTMEKQLNQEMEREESLKKLKDLEEKYVKIIYRYKKK